MDRITQSHLESLCNHINKITNSPLTPYEKGADGRYHAQVGNYHLDYAYGGVNLVRMCNDGGAITQPLGGGFHTKRELYERMHAFIRGIEAGKG